MLRRFGGLAALPFISLLVPFLLLPAISRVASKPEVAALGIGDSVGAVVALVVAFGWPLTGPARVARSGRLRGLRELAMSMVPRLIIFIIATVPGAILALALVPADGRWLCLLAMISASVTGLSPSWYFIGRGDAFGLAIYETGPRMLAGIAALVLVLTTRSPYWYPVPILIATVAMQTIFLFTSGVAMWLKKRSVWRSAWSSLRAETPAALAMITGGVYSTATVSLVAIGGTTSVVAVYGMSDRLFKASLTAIVSAANAVQGWVSEQDSNLSQRTRSLRAVLLLSGVGLIGGVGIACLGPWFTGWFFGQHYEIGLLTSSALGVAFLAVAVSTGVGRMVLVPAGRVRRVTGSTIVGAVVGGPSIVAGSALFGVTGAAVAFALSELIVVVIQVSGIAVLRMRAVRQAA
jgi:O-antigen/teichoic acid export membrane protein